MKFIMIFITIISIGIVGGAILGCMLNTIGDVIQNMINK